MIAAPELRRTETVAGLAVIVLLALAGLLAAPDPASAGAISCGDVITESIVLTKDLTDCPGDGLVVGADDLLIDLNGHTIDGIEPGGPAGGTGILVAGHDRVVVANGTIRGFSFGVVLDQSNDSTVRGLTVTENHIGIEPRFSEGNTIGNVVFLRNQNVGIRLGFADGNRIRNNEFRGGRWAIILQQESDANRVSNNVITGDGSSTDRGIQVGVGSVDNVVAGNRVAGYGQYGISVTERAQRTRVVDNRVAANRIHGIFVDDTTIGTVVRGNRSDGNNGDGVHVQGGATDTTVTDNETNDNGWWGVAALTEVRDRRGNRAAGNGQEGQCLGMVCREMVVTSRLTVPLNLYGSQRHDSIVATTTAFNDLAIRVEADGVLDLRRGDDSIVATATGDTSYGLSVESTGQTLLGRGDDRLVARGSFGGINVYGTIDGGPGADTIHGIADASAFTHNAVGIGGGGSLFGGPGADTITGEATSVRPGVATGISGGDSIKPQGGDDTITGIGINDIGRGIGIFNWTQDPIVAGAGNDTITGLGSDVGLLRGTYDGGRGDDTFRARIIDLAGREQPNQDGAIEDVVLLGRGGHDTFDVGHGSGWIDGGTGCDTLLLPGSADDYTIDGPDDDFTIERNGVRLHARSIERLRFGPTPTSARSAGCR